MRPTRKDRPNALIIALCAVLCAMAAAAAACAASAEGQGGDYRLAPWTLPARSPDFQLVDFDGRPRTMADYRGRIVVIFFGFLSCPEACPTELLKLALVMKQLGPASARVQVLFITLDPERDSRAALKGFVTGFDSRFIGLTGTNAQIDQAASSFNVQYARVAAGKDYTIDHSTATFVLDAAGRLRLIGASEAKVEDFVHDIATLAAGR
jgi:protein SCO1/2